jgi:hypothetical protein
VKLKRHFCKKKKKEEGKKKEGWRLVQKIDREIRHDNWKTFCEGIDKFTNPSYIWDRLKCRYMTEREHEYKELIISASEPYPETDASTPDFFYSLKPMVTIQTTSSNNKDGDARCSGNALGFYS